MKIALLGTDHPLEAVIAAACKRRGMDLVQLVHNSGADCASLGAEELRTYDAVVDAFAVGVADAAAAAEAACLSAHVAEVLAGLAPAVRLLVAGRAGGMYLDDSRSRRVIDTLSKEQQAVEQPLLQVKDRLAQSGADWTYFSPPAVLDPAGAPGGYIPCRDVLLLNTAGESRISYADYAEALADELERKRFVGKQFSAVSDVSGHEAEYAGNVIDMTTRAIFTRRGSYMGIFFDVDGTPGANSYYQTGRIFIGTRRGTPTGVVNQGGEMLFLTPTFQGAPVGYSVQTTAKEMLLHTAYGVLRLCFAEDRLLYVQGEQGLGLLLEAKLRPGEMMKKRGAASWEATFRWRCSLTLTPLSGSLQVDAPWDAASDSMPKVSAAVAPDASGSFLLAVEESIYAGKVRDSYVDYAAALADVKADWEKFLSYIPDLGPDFAEAREQATWILWSLLVEPSGLTKRPHMFMASRNVASSWQMCHNAVALWNNVPLAMDLMLNMIDFISPQGQLPDFVDDGKYLAQAIHPPTQGWALKWVMRTHDLKKEVPTDQLEMMYHGYGRWVDWFRRVRDDDKDGVPQYDNGDESGFDDCSPFAHHTEVETPDLTAYLSVFCDVLADLGEILEKPAEEIDAWRSRAEEYLKLLIDVFWDGERFIATAVRGGEVLRTDSIIYYLPIVLGKKLPQEIIGKLTADLMDERKYLTPYGLASEIPTSDHYRVSGFSRSWALPASNLMVLTGLYDAGKEEEAKLIARRYCEAVARWSFPTLLNPVRGGNSSFMCSWPACAFLTLADMVVNK